MYLSQKKSLCLATLCLLSIKISDTGCSKRKLFDIEGSDIQKLVDIAKPIIDIKYQEYAQLFTEITTEIANVDPQTLDMARTLAIIHIFNNPDNIFKTEGAKALKALAPIKFDQKFKVITVNSLIRTAINKLTNLAKKWVEKEGLAKPITRA